MQPKIIYSSNNDDEELLIPTAESIRGKIFGQIRAPQRPPTCFCCCNTKIGCYLIAALQVAYGFSHLFLCMIRMTAANMVDQPKDNFYNFTLAIYSMIVIGSGLMLFHGLSFSKGKLLRPSILIYSLIIIAALFQFIYFLLYWDDVSAQLREHLKYRGVREKQDHSN